VSFIPYTTCYGAHVQTNREPNEIGQQHHHHSYRPAVRVARHNLSGEEEGREDGKARYRVEAMPIDPKWAKAHVETRPVGSPDWSRTTSVELSAHWLRFSLTRCP
jgi:hypothetical protein